MKWWLFILTAFILHHESVGQRGQKLFNDTVLHRLDIYIDIPNWIDTIQHDYNLNAADEQLYPEIYRPCWLIMDGDTLHGCGLRNRGNFSNTVNRYRSKKQLKVAFDAFIDQKHDGIKKINLNNFTSDPSLVHEMLAYKLLRMAGVIAPRAAYTQVFVNGAYFGLYALVENVDKTFLADRFGKKYNDGMLYKTGRESSLFLDYIGEDSTAYQKKSLELKNDGPDRTWQPYIDFTCRLKRLKENPQPDSLSALFSVDTYLTVLAIEKIVRSWDNYWSNGNNFYLYAHPDGRMYWIPWDFNETFQHIRMLDPFTIQDSYLVPMNKTEYRPLLKAIFDDPSWHQAYLERVCTLMQTLFTPETIGPLAVNWHNLIRDAYRDDPNKINAFDAFERALIGYSSDVVYIGKTGYQLKVEYEGLFPFIRRQQQWVQEQLDAWHFPCNVPLADEKQTLPIYPNPTHDYIYVNLPAGTYVYGTLRLLNSSGGIVQSWGPQAFPGGPKAFDLTGLTPGMYFLILQAADGTLWRNKCLVF